MLNLNKNIPNGKELKYNLKLRLFFIIFVLFTMLPGCYFLRNQAPLTLALNGKTDFSIIESPQASEPEKYAARELAEFLKRVTGATFPIAAESSTSVNTPGIYVGQTKYAEKNGINPDALDEEEWIIKTVGKNLIITGGRPRGTLYGVYEFLEDYAGCHWLDHKTEVIPSKPTLTVKPLDIQTKPWFWQRWVHSPTGTSDDKWKFMVRNKNYRYDFHGRSKNGFVPKGAFYKLHGSPGKSHTFSYFVNAKDWYKSHPEYFSLVRGKRIPAYSEMGPGQLCLTNPDVRRLTLKKLREYIEKDREIASKEGCPPPKIYWITQNDKYHAHCQCKNCQVIAKREGSESGPLLDFINYIAEKIEKDYPDILIGTSAYNLTSTPPKNITPRGNVLIGWCDVYSKCDGIHPLTHRHNKENHDEITGWGKITPQLGIGDDYWTALSYYDTFPTPYEIITCVAEDIKLFADQGCKTFFAEAADYVEAGQHFIPLRFWLAYQLLVDPHQPVEPLIKIFTDGYYGPAAGKMREYLRYLRKRIDAEAQFKMLRDEPHELAYLDLEFFRTSEKLFDEAQKLVKPGSLHAKHIRDERFILDAALLFLWPWLERTLPTGKSMPFNKETVIKRFEEEWRSFVKGRYSRYYSHQKLSLNKDGKLMERMANLFRNPRIPEQFKNLPSGDVADFNWLTFSRIRPRQKLVPDKDATGGMAATFTEKSAIQKAEKGGDQADVSASEQHRKTVKIGVTGGPTITLKPEKIPQDGKYHLFEIGRVRVKPGDTRTDTGTLVWALEGKRLGVNVNRLFVPGTDDPTENDWNAYISLKFQGPAYVKGSKKPNGVWMDRVLLVKPQPGEAMSETYKKQLKEERRRAILRPRVKAPRLAKNAEGNPAKVNWKNATIMKKWSPLRKKHLPRKISAELVNDGEFLYVRLTEKMDPKTLVSNPGIWRGDTWEILFAPKRGIKPYRQIAINPDGKFIELAYGEGNWQSGVKVISEKGTDFWRVSLAFPLECLVPSGVKPGQKIHANILRGGSKPQVWSPTFGEKFHSLERLGEIIVE